MTQKVQRRSERPGEREGLRVWAIHRAPEEERQDAGFTDKSISREDLVAMLRQDAKEQRRIIARGSDAEAVSLARKRLASSERSIAKFDPKKS